MLISDWSSGVCSSDLIRSGTQTRHEIRVGDKRLAECDDIAMALFQGTGGTGQVVAAVGDHRAAEFLFHQSGAGSVVIRLAYEQKCNPALSQSLRNTRKKRDRKSTRLNSSH